MNVSYYCYKTEGKLCIGCHSRKQQKTKNKWSEKEKKSSIIQELRIRGNLRQEEMSNRVKYETKNNEGEDQKRLFYLEITRSPMTSKRMVSVQNL